jgi:hypothetical protein
MFEKIMEEFHEPFFGNIRIDITINKINLSSNKLNIEDKIKFYFWINVAGITNIMDNQKISSIF